MKATRLADLQQLFERLLAAFTDDILTASGVFVGEVLGRRRRMEGDLLVLLALEHLHERPHAVRPQDLLLPRLKECYVRQNARSVRAH